MGKYCLRQFCLHVSLLLLHDVLNTGTFFLHYNIGRILTGEDKVGAVAKKMDLHCMDAWEMFGFETLTCHNSTHGLAM